MALYDPPKPEAKYTSEQIRHRKNLALLADGLYNLPPDYSHFDMEVFFHSTTQCEIGKLDSYECGTVACALGHGPIFVEKPTIEEHLLYTVGWEAYAKRVFGISVSSDEFTFLFSGSWGQVDQSPKGAAKRIYYYLEHGSQSFYEIEDRCLFSENPYEFLEELKPLYENQSPVDWKGNPSGLI